MSPLGLKLAKFHFSGPQLATLLVWSCLPACGSSTDHASTNVTRPAEGTGGSFSGNPLPNVQPIRVNGGPNAQTAASVNQLYTDVTICIPGTSNCQTVSDVLVDTGSTGLRLLASEVKLTLPAVKDVTGSPLGE